MAYIKSHSNYVLRKKHQTVKDGTVWERDMSTLGGVDFFVNGEVPTYQSGNFVITRNPNRGGTIQVKPSKWQKNNGSGDTEVWTLSNVTALTSPSNIEDDTKIIIKKDYFDLRDFAYYGSLSELFRASLNDIAQRFPGELYSYYTEVYYTERKTVGGENISETKRLGGGFLLSNPYGIDIHTESLPKGADADKYFADDGFKGYSIIDGNNETPITSWDPDVDGECYKVGDKFATITLNDGYMVISAYFGDNYSVYYFTDKENIHIRPSSKRLVKFYDECNDFERVILNPDTTPRYKATFSIIKENEFGYYRELEDFIFPTLEGDYNLDVTSFGYNRYTSRLAEIGEYYDEYFCDNLYRCMTHESIKNFDWTFSRYEDENEEVIKGADKIKKLIRLYAREFDEVKSYIDAMKSLNKITYDDRSNIPDYFLTDSLEDDGWDVRKICPYSLDSEYDWNDFISGLSENVFYQDYSEKVKPYSKDNATEDYEKMGYFIGCCLEGDEFEMDEYSDSDYIKTVMSSGDSDTFRFDSCGEGGIVDRVRSHFDEREYSMFEIDNEFLRRLKINSRAILRAKGTIQGMEMILGMFGLKSSRYDSNDYDYSIEEYYLNTDGIPSDEISSMFTGETINTMEAINGTKLINYPSYEEDNQLRGLMLIYDDESDKYYPYYDEDESRDGDVYYQMGGGWMSNVLSGSDKTYNFQFDVNDNVVSNTEYDECRLYKETIRTIRKVKDLSELLAIPQATLNQYYTDGSLFCGIIYYVENLTNKVVALGGKVYPVESEVVGANVKYYVKFVKQNGFVQVGTNAFYDEVMTVTDRNGQSQNIYLRDKADGYVVRAFADSGGVVTCIGNGTPVEGGVVIDFDNVPNATNYFILRDLTKSTNLKVGDTDGWERLTEDNVDYKKINTIYNYVKGNNPHGNTFGYDMGRSYVDYLRQPFKYALDNDLFDDRCYNNYGKAIDSISKIKFVFNGLNENGIGYTLALLPSDKIIYDDGEGHIKDFNGLPDVNTKRVRIAFDMTKDGIAKDDKEFACKLKYLDDIVSNYLMQMIPSTSIVEVVYKY